ncbi:hypothetical protein [Chryseobacterium phocaeense]|uniref:hypothetical protein n=1 Tax=Chryseobacterium phocaeense TaxID=1816690 RepID=UPI0009BC5430|nr:hypothetical protein [Chryseobacterium phocaeense]
MMEEEFTAWIIKYKSPKFIEGIYLIWYPDINDIDQFLTLDNGKIFMSTSLKNLPAEMGHTSISIENREKMISWLNREFAPDQKEIAEDNFYDLNILLKELELDVYSVETIENFTNFINLFGDYARQSKKNNFLLEYENNGSINELWTYFYEAIFWPRFKDKEKFDPGQLPPLKVNKQILLEKFKEIVSVFDEQIAP